MRYHTVRVGDTLGRIARRYDVPIDSIVRLNGVADPDRIAAGLRLEIPEVTTDAMDLEPLPRPSPPRRGVPSSGRLINKTRFRLPAKEYFPEAVPKELIILHFTAGRTAKRAYQTWLGQPVHVATAYLVEPDGSIFETFDPAHWAYHLGIRGTRGKHDRRSIGIEIVNAGPLKIDARDPERLNWWPRGWKTKYCVRDQRDRYVQSSHRGIDFFAAMPEVQQDAVAWLALELCDAFGIPRRIPGARRRTGFDEAHFAAFKGVAAHQNFRSDKWDVGPAFDWDRLGL